jgi:hypothetical protein
MFEYILVGGLEHFSEGLKPPTSIDLLAVKMTVNS